MNILFLSHYFYPHIGGVEKHVLEVSKSLIKKGHAVTVITEKYESNLKDRENIEGIKVIRFPHKDIKYFGLINIWVWLFRHRKLIKSADIVHCHDVFIWYLPFRFFFPQKKVLTTVHGFEWDNPLSQTSLIQKRIAVKLSNASVGVGKFLEKYLRIHFNKVIYGAATPRKIDFRKQTNTIVYVGRLEANTGLLKFLKWVKNSKFKVDFCGDGNLKEECNKYGTVHGFIDPSQYYKNAAVCVPGGYLAALEALSYGCDLKLFWNNKVKEDYWNMSPFIQKNAIIWAKKQTWEKLANEYISLYNSI